MRKLVVVLLALVVAAGVGYVVATHRPHANDADTYKGNGQVRIPRPETNGNEIGLTNEQAHISTQGDPIAGALDALMKVPVDATHPRAIPEGTRVLDVKVENGVANVNLSKEFNKLRDSGDTAESLAQNSLRKTLAQFPSVKSMLVRVDGKPFESEHTDWTEPIPVRDEDATTPAP